MSTGPSASSRSARARTAVRLARSTRWPRNVRPRRSTCRATALSDSSRAALTPMMSAPASARAQAIARPIPRRQPVTTATLPLRSNRSARGSGIVAALAVDQDLHVTAAFQRVERLVDLAEGHDAGDELVGRDGSLSQQVDGPLDVATLVDARADDRQLPPEEAKEVDLARYRVDRHHHETSAYGQDLGGRCDAGGRAGDLEGDGGAGSGG